MSRPNVMRAGLNAMAMIRRMWDKPAPTTWPELFRDLCDMRVRPVKPQGKTHRQLEKQRARNRRRRPRSLWKSQ
jgi:hypothetical protein